MTTKTKPRTEKALSKSEITAALSESTGLTKAQVASLFDSLADAGRQEHRQRRPRHLHAARPAEDQGGPQAGHSGSHRHQPVHQARDDLQGQAGPQRRQAASPQDPQGHGLRASVAVVSGPT